MDEIKIATDTHHRSPWSVLAVLCASVFIIVVDGTIVNVALPTFVRELGATTSQLQWIVDAYVLVFAGLLMAAGSIGDRFGRKGTLMIGMAAFAMTSILAALSTTPAQLIGWRAAMGIGAALIFPATLAILVNVFTDARQRVIAISIWAATSGLAVALGPVSGGFLLEHFFWGSVFLVNVPVIVVAMVAIWRLVPTSRDTTIRRFDPLGIALSISGVTVLVWAVIEGPKHGWTSSTGIGAFALAASLLTAFIRWERHSDHPMLDVGVFTNMRFTAGSVSVAFAFFALFGFIFMVTQYFQFVRGYGTLEAGVRTVPFALFTGMAAPLSAKLAERFGTKASSLRVWPRWRSALPGRHATLRPRRTGWSSGRCCSWEAGSVWSTPRRRRPSWAPCRPPRPASVRRSTTPLASSAAPWVSRSSAACSPPSTPLASVSC